jgi:methylglutaconyl-CoA hydratase
MAAVRLKATEAKCQGPRMDPIVLFELRPPAAIITINRPTNHNALSRTLIDDLHAAFERARDNDAARCVVLTAVGRVFCAGMDLAELAASLQLKEEESGIIWDDVRRLCDLFQLIYTLPKPTVAAVNGSAVAGGAGLVTVCDLALAVPEAKFGYPEVRRGLVAAMVMPHLLRHVGERTARYLLLTGELINAAEANGLGLINEVVPAAELQDRTMDLCRALAEGGPNALARTKELLHRFSHQAVPVEDTARASAEPRLTQECRQGLEAFFAKKPVPWAP